MRHSTVALISALTLALVVAGLSGWVGFRGADQTPDHPGIPGRLGQTVRIETGEFTVRSIEVRDRFPNRSGFGDPEVHALPGAVIVKVQYDVRHLDAGQRYCTEQVIQHPGRADRRIWSTSSDYTWQVFEDPSYGCAVAKDGAPGEPVRMGVLFELPAEAVRDAVLSVGFTDGPALQVPLPA